MRALNSQHAPATSAEEGKVGELEIFPVAIGVYDHHVKLDVEAEVARVVALFAEFGGHEVPWLTEMAHRGADSVNARLQEWARPVDATDAVLYWVGHGWCDGDDVALAHARSMAAVRTSGVLPVHLAEPARSRQLTGNDKWAIIIVDTCWSSRFIDKLNAELAEGPLGADRVLLVGVSGDGATSLGQFPSALQACFHENFRTNRKIELWQLAAELERRLPQGRVAPRRLAGTALVRRLLPVAANVTVPLDVLRELEEYLSRLSGDERRHFLVKAQGAEEGEISWFFEGRALERTQIVSWLRTVDTGMMTVTGRAGSGKSALLGQVLVQSLPDVRNALISGGLIDRVSEEELPPDGVFNEVIHLTGITLDDLIVRIARAADLGETPSAKDPAAGYGIANDIDWLVDSLRARKESFTLLVDALDEASEPLAVARTVLGRLAGIPGVRVLVGTRTSTRESPDHPDPHDENLLDALGANDEDMHEKSDVKLITVAHDRDAVSRYVIRRLTAARNNGMLVIDGSPVDNTSISRAAEVIGKHRREFLFARLAVYEIMADPTLLDTARSLSLNRLLAATDHRALFAAAADRLTRRSDSFQPLLEALALTRGRGLPIRDGIWALVATALADEFPPDNPITDADISALLAAAQPYIAVDSDFGQTVYRLAHRTFAEHFLSLWEPQ